MRSIRALFRDIISAGNTALDRRKAYRLHGINQAYNAGSEVVDHILMRYNPVFVLSTGRSGSTFVAQLLAHSSGTRPHHEPYPSLYPAADWIFANRYQDETLKGVLRCTRLERALEAYLSGQIYVESNQCLSFAVRGLLSLFQNARVLHLVRHPGAFVTSAARKGWYTNDSLWEISRPRPTESSYDNQVTMLSWYWKELNSFVESQSREMMDSERYLRVRVEDLFGSAQTASKVVEFAGGQSLSSRKLGSLQRRRVNAFMIPDHDPPNMRRNPTFPKYESWGSELKEKVNSMVGELARSYGYDL